MLQVQLAGGSNSNSPNTSASASAAASKASSTEEERKILYEKLNKLVLDDKKKQVSLCMQEHSTVDALTAQLA